MAIQPKNLNQVSPHLRQMFEKGKAAILQKNYPYAFQILRDALRHEPGFLEARLALRQAQLERVGNKAGIVRQAIAFVTTFWTVFIKGPALLKKGKIAAALDAAESAMQADPTLISTINFLVRAALAANLLPIAVNALEVGARFNPKNVKVIRELARLYQKVGEDGKAVQLLQRLCELRPNDLALQNELRQATATAAMKQGWDRAESFRDVIRDRKQAEILEQRERIAPRDSEALEQLIQAAEEELAETPSAANHKRLADLYRRKKDYDKALEHYNAVVEITGALDPAIDEAITSVLAERFDDAVRQWEAYAEKNPDKRAEAEEKIQEIRKQKEETLFERLQERVRRYPNDARFRYELAEVLYRRGDIDRALKEFQQASRNPQLRWGAAIWMGRCLLDKGLSDLAIERLQEVIESSAVENDLKKEALYYLASAYEKAGRRDEAVDCLKRIYAVDVNYRDVAQRIEQYYQSSGGGA